MDLLENLESRGLIHDISDRPGIAHLKKDDLFYIGYDPTAQSLQIGNLIPIIVSIHLAKWGLKPLQLFGGSTGAIGDPSGRNVERQLLTRDILDHNISAQRTKAQEIFDRVKVKVEFLNNLDWTKNVDVLTFLREVGKFFTVNYMLGKESVQTRMLADGISYTEFSYMLLQAYDFYHLYQTRNCKLQIGGSDQWGNITAGLELIRKKIQGEAYAVSWPLITDSQGKKFGKSEGGAIWLDERLTSPYKLHQFFLNTPDADVLARLKIFTFQSLDKLKEIEKSLASFPERRETQSVLADSVCDLVHGEAATQDAKKCAQVLFGGSLEGVPENRLEDIFSDAPSSTIAKDRIAAMSLVDLLLETKLVPSKSEARRLISSGGAYLNNERMLEPEFKVSESRFVGSRLLVVRTGKKNYHLVKIS